MATGRSRKSPSRLRKTRKKREQRRRRREGRHLRVETLEERRLLAVGPQVIGVQPNDGALLNDGDIRNIAPRDLTFQFNEGQVIDATTLDALTITQAGLDGQFDVASGRTDFGTGGAVVVEFRARTAGPRGNEISLQFSKTDRGGPGAPSITVQGKTIFVELNSNLINRTTASALVNTLNNHLEASELIEAIVIAGPGNTNIAAPAITYSPVDVGGANVASVTSNFNTGTNLEVVFIAVQGGPAANGINIHFTKSDHGGASDPVIDVVDQRNISIDLNSNVGNQTTPAQLVTAFNANAEARALVVASNPVGDPDTDIATPAIDYSPLVLDGANDVTVTPGYLGLGDSDREVIFRFAETPPDDLYRIDIIGVDSAPLRNEQGIALGDRTDDDVDNGEDFSLQFELDLGAQVLGVVPQPVIRTGIGTLSQSTSQIEVYFNDDDLDPISATNPSFYQLVFTEDTVESSDDEVYHPIAVQYFPSSDRAMLTFRAPLHQLGSGSGTFRLRVGTDEALESVANPMPPTSVDLSGAEVGSSFATAHDLGGLTGSQIVSSAIDPQVHSLAMPGSNDEPGHRDLAHRSTSGFAVESHLLSVTDPVNGLSTLFYNFREDYGVDPDGNALTNLITEQQKQRAREIFEIFGGTLGVQFVETETQGFTIATGDMRAANPGVATGGGDGIVFAALVGPLDNDLLIVMDNAENWYNGFGRPDDPAQVGWFEEAMQGIASLLGLGYSHDLPSSTMTSEDVTLDFGVAPEPIYPGDHDVVHGQHLYRPEGSDIDLYKFELTENGLFTATTVAERQTDTSLLDSVIALYREQGGQRELIARNDDYSSDDSHIELDLEPGVYYVGVSSTGNDDYNPVIEDSGYGGLTEGEYDLRLTFRPDVDSSILDLDNSLNDEAGAVSRATALDGDGDGVPGGVFNYWFRVDATPIIVDKTASAGGNGNITSPFKYVDDALAVAREGDVVRIVGNGGDDDDLSTSEDAEPYEIGFDLLGRPLADGATMDVPEGVAVMIDRGAVFKMRRARIGVGSSSPSIDRSAGSLQVLGTPRMLDIGGNVLLDADGNTLPGSVFFTSLNDESLGGDSNPSVDTTPLAGDWGGLSFRADLDRAAGRFDYENEGIFLNYVNQADMRYGGGSVIVEGVPRVIAPVHATDVRPTVTYNTITYSADAAISANPNSFEETTFQAPQYQDVPFAPDYTRVGPDVHGNRLMDNSINGMFVRQRTPAGGELERMTVPARWDDSDVVHVVAETLKIQGSPGGPIQYVEGPDASLVSLQTQQGGAVPAMLHYYRVTFVDANGNEAPASDPTSGVLVSVTDPDTEETESVLLGNLPVAPAPYVGRNLYRTTEKSARQYVRVAELNATDRTYLDDATVLGGLLEGSTLDLTARLHGRLAIDPGTIVKMNGAGIEATFGAQLIAEGQDGSEVVFTSLLDNRYGAGGTFETSAQGNLSAGNWSGIFVGPMGRASIDHAVLAYGGGVSEVAGNFAGFNVVEVQQGEARITNSVIENNANGTGGQATPNRGGHGSNAEAAVFVRGAQPVIVNNVLRDNAGAAISIDLNSLNHELLTDYGRSTGVADAANHIVDNQGPLVRENRLANNDINGMRVRGGTLTTEGVWDDTDIAHVVQDETVYVTEFHTYGGLRLESSGNESLVVKLEGANAGFTATGRPLDITDRAGGVLQIIGQPGFPVVLTSLRDDSAAAGFQPGGSPQSDTNNDGEGSTETGSQAPTLPTVPDVPNGTLIDNNVPVTIPGHFEFQPAAGGDGFDGVTAQGNSQLFQNASFIFDFTNYVDVGRDGNAVELGLTTVANPPALTAPDEVTSDGNFAGANGQIDWVVRSYFLNGVATLFNEVTFTSQQAFGDVQFINYLDEDVLGISDDLLYPFGTPGQPDFEAYTLDNAERIGFSQGGFYLPGPELANATYDGWAADEYWELQLAIEGSGTTYTIPGNIDTASLTPFMDPTLGQAYGLENVTTAFAWTLDPTATTATVTTFLNLIPQDPTSAPSLGGDWGSVRMEQWTHDRNVDVTTEQETGNVMVTGTNEIANTAEFLGFLAPDEKAGDDNRRLGFEVHGSLNRPGDVDVYSFDADVGTEVWLDVDRTTYSLDTVVELIDSNGNILALSDNSAAEAADPGLLVRDPLVMEADEVNPLSKSSFDSRDLWSTNPRDAGMRVVLPGPEGTTNTYHVRVRSSSDDLSAPNGGLTSGVYQLQVRLREADELPGSTVQMADIRNGTTGIDLVGQPAHSPLTGEAAEALDAAGNDLNDPVDVITPTGFDDLGNLLNSDRGTISVAGRLESFEAQTISFAAAPTIGNFVLGFMGYTTTNIPFDADAAAIQAALEALPSVGPGNVVVTGAPGGPFDVGFQGALANTDLPQMTAAAGVPAIDEVPTTATTADGGTADVDWYRFEVRYDAVASEGSLNPNHAAVVFDMDYADGFARANTNLWVFDSQGQMLLVGRDSNVAEDRPIGGSSATEDLSRGSIGPLDPFIGTVELPASGFAPGVYYVAVSSNAVVPDEMQQFLTPTPVNPFVRLEPINSINRIAEDHVGDSQGPTATNTPQIPVLFGQDDRVTLHPPDGSELVNGETFTVTNELGSTVIYEFVSDGLPAEGNVAVEYDYTDSSLAVGTAIMEAITENPPASPELPDPNDPDQPVPTANAPLVYSTLDVTVGPAGEVTLTETVERRTLLNTVTTTDFVTNQLIVTPLTRTTTHQVEPEIRRHPAPGISEISLYVSRPAITPFDLGDVTLFISQDGLADRTEVLSADAFTGQAESRIGAFGANVGDIALDPRGAVTGGGLFAYSIPDDPAQWTDAATGNYWQIDPGSATPANLGTNVGDDGTVTYMADAAGKEVIVNGKAGIGVQFNAMTFNNEETQAASVQGFAIGNRGDTYVDPVTGQVFSTATGVPNPANILFEFDPATGAAVGATRGKGAILVGGGTDIEDRGALDTTVDAFPIGGSNTTVTGVEATVIDASGITPITQFYIEDGDYFEIDEDGDGIVDKTFEFDSGPEVYFVVDTTNSPTDPNVIRDADRFTVDAGGGQTVQFEFDTGTVIVVNAQNGNQLNDGGIIQISDNATNPVTITFEFDNNNDAGGNTPIPFTTTDNQQAIITNIINAINGVPSYGVNAVQLPGTNRITLLGESVVSAATVAAAGVVGDGSPGVLPAAIAIPVEETFDVDEIGLAIMNAANQPPGYVFEAGAVGNRLNFMGAVGASFAGVTHPIFGNVNLVTGFPTGTAGTLGQFNLPVPFLASDNAAEIAARVHTAVVAAGVDAVQTGAAVVLEEDVPQPAFVCISLGTPPLIGAPGTPDCPLRSGGSAPGGSVTGMAFIGPQLYAVTDTGGLFRIADSVADPLDPDLIPGRVFNPANTTNVADYLDGSRELLQAVNTVTRTTTDPLTGEETEIETTEPIRFAGLVAGPRNTEEGRYENVLIGIDNTGRLFAFDTHGRPQAIFANGAFFADTDIAGANGLAFSNLDDNLWHVTLNEPSPAGLGHGVVQSFDGSRLGEDPALNTSLYFGYEDDQVQSQFGTGVFGPPTPAPGIPALTYDFPGGSHGGLVSNAFSLEGYSGADNPTLYFNYFLDTEQAENTYDTTLVNPFEGMLDSFRVYISGDDGRWKILSTNNSALDVLNETYLDEFDPFFVRDPITGEVVPEQPFDRSETFDSTGTWRQARVDLSPYAGQDNLRLRFDFSTAGGFSTGGMDVDVDLNTAGNELRAIPGTELRDGQMFTLTDIQVNPDTDLEERVVVAAFEFDMGPTIVAPTGAALIDGVLFDVDGRVYEFDNNGAVGATNNIPHVPVPFDGEETAGELAANIEQVILQDPPPPTEILGDLSDQEPNDTMATAFPSGLNGTTQVFRSVGIIGDNFTLTDITLDVDMVAFHLDAGDSVTLETNTSRLATQLDSYLRLFDADGNPLAANDNVDPENPFSKDSRIDFTAPARGTYYVGISSRHNADYKPDVPASGGASGGAATTGFYEFTISVTDPTGPQRIGNRLNLSNANVITASGPAGTFVDSFVEGQAGVTPGLPNPFGPSLPSIPVYSIRADAGMTNMRVADAIQTSLADNLAGGNVETIKREHEIVQVVQYGIGDAGPLGLSGPSDPNTALVNSGLFGDLFGAFGSSAGVDGQTGVGFPGAVGMRNNQFGGVHIDDITIGFASRGEMVTGAATQATTFGVNTDQPAGEIDFGAYQVEIRQSSVYGISDPSPEPTLQLYRGFDVDDRLAEGFTLTVDGGHVFRDGQTFMVSDGAQSVTFEFDDSTLGGGAGDGVAAGNEAILFSPSDSDVVMARRVRDAINAATAQQLLDITAVSTDGVVTGVDSTSNRIDLFGDVTLTVGLFGNGPSGNLPVDESNDTLATAFVTGVVGGGREGLHASGMIGDNGDLDEFGADVDLFRVELNAGELITIDVDASELFSPLDSVLRVFDSTGAPVMETDDLGNQQPVESDDDIAPGESAVVQNILFVNRDSFLAFTAPANGVYYIGVSGYDNNEYDPTLDPNADANRRPATPGHYEIDIQRPADTNGFEVVAHEGTGDENLERDQGQIIIDSNRLTGATGFGIVVGPGQQASTNAPRPGAARNLSQLNNLRLAPGVTITNNVIANNEAGGIDFQGDPGLPNTQPAPVPFGRIVNNTIVGGGEGASQAVTLDFVQLTTGVAGGDPAETTVYRADLSALTAPAITAITISDNSINLGLPGRYSGFDLDGIKLSTNIATDAALVETLPSLNVFDFTTAGTTLTPGSQQAPVDPDLFGTAGGNLDNQVATLGSFDADSEDGPAPDGFASLGFGGTIKLDLTTSVSTVGTFLYIGLTNDEGEFALANITADIPPAPAGVGINIANNASPTILNNVLSTLATAIEVDATSATTVVGGSLYHNNDVDTNGVGVGDFAIVADPGDQLFVDARKGNFYPAKDSPLIDSSVDSLDDRFAMVQMGHPLGIPPSPILAPVTDVSGQLRVDDPSVAPPPGMGERIFKDRGAQDRADFTGPGAEMVGPLDNGVNDLDPNLTLVNLFRASLDQFSIQLVDGEGSLGGIGVDDSTVTGKAITVIQDSQVLIEGEHYAFDFNSTSNVIRLTPLAGVWDQESNYVIRLASGDRFVVFAASGNKTMDGDWFDVIDQFGNSTTFEYDSGYVIEVPQTLAVQIPTEGGALGGVGDGDTITVENTVTEAVVTFELDSDGVVDPDNTGVAFTATSTQGEIADSIVVELDNAGLTLNPSHPGGGLVHLGVEGNHTLIVTSNTIVALGVPVGVADGESFTVDDGTKVITFEFSEGAVGGFNVVPVGFTPSMTAEQIGANIAAAIDGANLGLDTQHLGDGRVHVGGSVNHLVDVSLANLTLTGQPGARLPWGLRIPTSAGAFTDLLADGETFVIDTGAGVDVTFELDDDGDWTPGNTAIPFSDTNSTWQLANTIVSRVRNAGLGLFPVNIGNGIVAFGGDPNFSLDVTNTALSEVGEAGRSGAIAIPFTPDESFTAEQMAQVTAQVVNSLGLPEISAEAIEELVYISGASNMSGSAVTYHSGIKDLAGNPLRANQVNGDTQFTVFVGAGMDYGDAPLPYPTLRADGGARHVIVDGFSLGATVQVNADGQPTTNADGDNIDEDGVEFNPLTPLIPSRTFDVTVSTSGIGTVVPFGVLDAWIDFNRDGDWNDFNEHVITNEILTTSVLTGGEITFTGLDVPSNASVGDSYARFRLSAGGNLDASGEADAGEVEDYLVTISANPWQNPTNRFDVNNNGTVSPVDVLTLINFINPPNNGAGTLSLPKPAGVPFFDVTGDGVLSSEDVLALILEINRLNQQGEGEFRGLTALAAAGAEGEAPIGAASDVLAMPSADAIVPPLDARDTAGVVTRSYESRSAAESITRSRGNGSQRVVERASASRLSARGESTEPNHLADILSPDESWMGFVEDVDLAMQDDDARDSFFADLGV